MLNGKTRSGQGGSETPLTDLFWFAFWMIILVILLILAILIVTVIVGALKKAT